MTENNVRVTRDDLAFLRGMRANLDNATDAAREMVDRLIAAAEADQPPLPEGWYLLNMGGGASRVLWHADGMLYEQGNRALVWSDVDAAGRESLSPLRPTITEADVEKAALCLYEDGEATPDDWPPYASDAVKAECRAQVRAIFAAAGIEAAGVEVAR